MTLSSGVVSVPASESEVDAQVVESAKILLVALAKAANADRLYETDNPARERFVIGLKEAFGEMWGLTDSLTLRVEDSRILVAGEPVYTGESPSESLAFAFWKSGIRQLVFRAGFEEHELEVFLGILRIARSPTAGEYDAVTSLWEADCQFLEYTVVDLFGDVDVPEAKDIGDVDLTGVASMAVSEPDPFDNGQGRLDSGPSKVNREDFKPTLYALDAAELNRLQLQLKSEMERDLEGDVLSALFDRLEEQRPTEQRLEILDILRRMLPDFLPADRLDHVVTILEELTILLDDPGSFEPAERATVDRVLETMSEPEALEEFLRSLREGFIAPDVVVLGKLFQCLRPGAIRTLLKLARRSGEQLRPILREGVNGIARRYPEETAELLRCDDPVVVIEALLLVGRLGLKSAGPMIGELVTHQEPEVRRTTLKVIVQLKAASLYHHLETMLRDEVDDVRIESAQAIQYLDFEPGVQWLEAILSAKTIQDADLKEKMAVFKAYGSLGGERAEKMLVKLMGASGGFRGKKQPHEIRACAAMALGEVGTDSAIKTLRGTASDSSPLVRNAASQALKRAEQRDLQSE